MSDLTSGTNQFLRSAPKEYDLKTPADGTLVLTSQGTTDGCQINY